MKVTVSPSRSASTNSGSVSTSKIFSLSSMPAVVPLASIA